MQSENSIVIKPLSVSANQLIGFYIRATETLNG